MLFSFRPILIPAKGLSNSNMRKIPALSMYLCVDLSRRAATRAWAVTTLNVRNNLVVDP